MAIIRTTGGLGDGVKEGVGIELKGRKPREGRNLGTKKKSEIHIK